jgi:hypothetical protein
MTIEEFEDYHKQNPQVYAAFEKFTLQVIGTGRKYFSARAIYERMRWYSLIEDNSVTFKISDHPMPFYARLFERNHPEHAGFFRKKRCEADKVVLNHVDGCMCSHCQCRRMAESIPK